ncbi:hypothetical protein EYF80_032372 [Liparis tanakae]|uniref:Uncharacterized protein n=1 Tax=Liparis tanakae TaxID=230148 RepID=A0A4Z2GXA3_9TELE|nr:hypothetical protein EYF80_032372 [Liparis tanakae]
MCGAKRGETYVISFAAELPEGLNVEPGALVPGRVQRNPHGVLLQQSRKTLVHLISETKPFIEAFFKMARAILCQEHNLGYWGRYTCRLPPPEEDVWLLCRGAVVREVVLWALVSSGTALHERLSAPVKLQELSKP